MEFATHAILSRAADALEASLKRSKNTSKNPKLTEVYEEDLKQLAKARIEIDDLYKATTTKTK